MMTETVTAREADGQFSRLLAEVAAGREVVITGEDGAPVARLVPERRAPAEPRRGLTPEQERALAETLAFARSLAPRQDAAAVEHAPWDRDWIHDRDVDRRGGD